MSTHQEWDITTGVGLTALAVAAARAVEADRADALARDPYAKRLVAAAHAPTPLPTSVAEAAERDAACPDDEGRIWASTSRYIGLRTRVFDDWFTEVVGEGAAQVVILASGLDTRPFRLPWPSGTVCFELDQPAVLDHKIEVLRGAGAAAACDHRPLRVDLRDDWGQALEDAGYDRSRPTAWLAEGLLPYLPPEAEADLFQEISRLSCSGSRLAVEDIADATAAFDDSLKDGSLGQLGVDVRELFPEGTREPVDAQLSRLGWKLRQVPVADSAARLELDFTGMRPLVERIVHVFAELA